MKSLTFVFVCFLTGQFLFGAEVKQSQAALDIFKSLQGKWVTTPKDGKQRSAEYEVVAGGSAVQETFTMGDSDEAKMLTLFHLNGEKLMLTHYCIAQNQPRMQATSISPDLKEIHFDFLDATNLSSTNTGHMYKAEFRFVDKDTFVSKWTYRENGKDKMVEEDTFTRVQQ